MNRHSNANYATVEQKVHSIVDKMEGVKYLFNNWAQANVNVDGVDSPTIIYVLPPSGQLYLHNDIIKDYPQSQIAFVAPTEFDFEGEDNDNIIERMKRLCIRFIKEVNDSGLFEQIDGGVQYQVLYDHFDENMTGIVATLTLKETRGINLCNGFPMRKNEDIGMM